MKVVFRVDSSMQIGAGHLVRCLALAEKLRELGALTSFISGNQMGNLNNWLQSKGVSVTVLPQAAGFNSHEDAEQTILALNGESPDWLVVDHYGIDIEWERRLKHFARRIMVIDDFTGRRHECDVLFDQNYSPDGVRRYDGLIPTECKKIIGPNYALLRDEFRGLREKTKIRQSLKKILIFFTAGDDKGETLKAMLGVELFGRVKQVDVVVGNANEHKTEIQHKCDDLNWGYHCQIDYMPKLIANADLVVGAGGASSWERCALGAPALVTILAANQENIALELHSRGAVLNLGWFHNLNHFDYANAFSSLSKKQHTNMSTISMAIVDAAGAMRVAEMLVNF